MITRFVEVTDKAMYGKFMVCRLDAEELATETAMPEAPPGTLLRNYAGRRRFNDNSTLVIDLQLGQAAAWSLEGGPIHYQQELAEKHQGLRVCPMYHTFVEWLYVEGKWASGSGSLEDIPRYVELGVTPRDLVDA